MLRKLRERFRKLPPADKEAAEAFWRQECPALGVPAHLSEEAWEARREMLCVVAAEELGLISANMVSFLHVTNQ